MRKVWFLSIMVTVMFAVGGCDEEQLGQADKIVTDANDIAAGVQVFLSSPAGAAVPPDWRLYGALGAGVVSIIANGWQQFRNGTMKKTTKAIVKGIEKVERQGNPKPAETAAVKEAIAKEMITAGIFDRGNTLVDQLKISR